MALLLLWLACAPGCWLDRGTADGPAGDPPEPRAAAAVSDAPGGAARQPAARDAPGGTAARQPAARAGQPMSGQPALGQPMSGQPMSGQPVALALNNAWSMALDPSRSPPRLLTLYRDRGAALLALGVDGPRVTVADTSVQQVALHALPGAEGTAVMVAFTRPDGVYTALSQDGGETFGAAERVAAARRPQAPAVRLWRGPAGPEAALTWHTGGRSGAALYAASWRGGTWSAPQRLDPGGAGSFATLAGGEGWTVAVWKDTREGGGEPRLYAATLEGETWSPARPLGLRGADPSLCLDSAGRLQLAFQQEPRTVVVTHSADRGLSWSTPKALDSRPGLFARIACGKDGAIAVTWESFTKPGSIRDDHIKAVGLARSRDGGQSFVVERVDGDRTGQIRATAEVLDDGSAVLAWVNMLGTPAIRWATVTP